MKSRKYKNFILYDNVLVSDIENFNCDETLNGACYKNKTLDECLELCGNMCGAGYYIKKHGICIPIHFKHSENIYSNLVPSSNITDLDIVFFVNSNIHNFPPKKANFIYNNFKLNIQHVKSGKIINSNYGTFANLTSNYKENTGVVIILDSNTLKRENVFNVHIPHTNLFLRNSREYPNTLFWETSIHSEHKSFKIIPKKNTKNIEYYDEFYIQHDDSHFVSAKNDILVLENIHKDKAETYRFIPLYDEKVFTCNGGKCESTLMKNASIDLLRNSFRDSNCLNTCNKSNKVYLLFLVVVLFIFSLKSFTQRFFSKLSGM